MIKYIIYTQKNCEYCAKAKKRLAKEKAHVEERLLDTTEKIKRFKKAGYNTVPQVFLHIGGDEELKSFLNNEEVSFKPDIKLVEETKPTAKIIPLVGAISGDKEKE